MGDGEGACKKSLNLLVWLFLETFKLDCFFLIILKVDIRRF